MIARQGLPVQLACRVLAVSEAGYYARRSRSPSARSIRHAWITDVIRQVHAASRETYGIRRVHAELTLGRGIAIGHQAVELLMRRAGVQGISGRPRFRRVPGVITAADRVERQFHRDQRDELWVTDITEHRTREGKVYCAVVLDAWSRRVVGWSINSTPSTALVTNALGMAIEQRRPKGDTIIHSDHGTAVHVLGIHPTRHQLGSPAVDRFRWRLLRQRHDGVILESDAGRTARPQTLVDARGACQRHLRIPGDIPQSPATPLIVEYADTGRIRGPQSTNTGSVSPRIRLHQSQDSPESL